MTNTTVRVGPLGLRRKGTGLVREPLNPKHADYLVRDHLPPAPAATTGPVDWRPNVVLDQGSEGACAGFGYTCEVIAPPAGQHVTRALGNRFGRHLWMRAKHIRYGATEPDKVTDPSQGTSMESAALAGRDLGLFDRFYWATSIEDVRAAIQHGPVPIAVYVDNWLSTGPDEYTNNFRKVDPAKARTTFGAHCMCLVAYDPAHPFPPNRINAMKNPGPDVPREPAYFIQNSWGADWGSLWTRIRIRRQNPRPGRRFRWKVTYGATGGGWIRETDLAFLLDQYGWRWGSAVLPQGRVDPDDLGGLQAIIDAHPYDAPYTKPADGVWGPNPR